MTARVQRIEHRLLSRRCVSCGYDGDLLRDEPTHCARCGCDLVERPARSYAEMEGLIGQPLRLDGDLMTPRSEATLVERWLTFLFFIGLGFVAVAWLMSMTVA